ncbi:hypothetical protein KIPB_013213, partial [Kipferlia bialata]
NSASVTAVRKRSIGLLEETRSALTDSHAGIAEAKAFLEKQTSEHLASLALPPSAQGMMREASLASLSMASGLPLPPSSAHGIPQSPKHNASPRARRVTSMRAFPTFGASHNDKEKEQHSLSMSQLETADKDKDRERVATAHTQTGSVSAFISSVKREPK